LRTLAGCHRHGLGQIGVGRDVELDLGAGRDAGEGRCRVGCAQVARADDSLGRVVTADDRDDRPVGAPVGPPAGDGLGRHFAASDDVAKADLGPAGTGLVVDLVVLGSR